VNDQVEAPPYPTANDAAFPATSSGAYFAAVYGLTLVLLLPALAGRRGWVAVSPERFAPLTILSFFAPLLGAVIAWRLARRSGPVRAPWVALRMWKVSIRWYVIALLLPGSILTGALAVDAISTGTDVGPWFYPPSAQQVVAMALFPFIDQIGWRGFAFPRLEARYGTLPASLVLGVGWALWYVEKHLLMGEGASLSLLLLVVMLIAGTVVYSWIYGRTGGSLLVVVVAQMGAYLNNSVNALPGDTRPLLAHTIGYCVVSVALVLADKKVWRAPETVERPPTTSELRRAR
jgi:membrane protease YdiL (CAAX protease family)